MDRSQLRGKVEMVSGLIAPEQLGATLMHEHVLCDITRLLAFA
jgi:phosphotriesterase-related protein